MLISRNAYMKEIKKFVLETVESEAKLKTVDFIRDGNIRTHMLKYINSFCEPNNISEIKEAGKLNEKWFNEYIEQQRKF